MYQSLIALLLLPQLLGAIISPQFPPHRSGGNHGWRAATYRGLTIGTSTRADMLRILGKPLSSVPSVGQAEPWSIIWNDYGVLKDGMVGSLSVEVDSRNHRIVGISISPDNLSEEEAIKYFGNDYRKVNYSFCEGLPGDAESGPVYENPDRSDIAYVEYRSRGIAIHLDYRGKVNAIYFVNAPVGLGAKEDCKGEIEKLKGGGGKRS